MSALRAIAGLAVVAVVAGACVPAADRATRSATPGAQGTRPRTVEPPAISIPTDAAGKPVVMVWMGEHYYSPAELVIPVGTTVMWRMLGGQEHDLWAYDGTFHSPTMGPGDTFTFTFTRPGVHRYFCAPHYGDGMTGSITVTSP